MNEITLKEETRLYVDCALMTFTILFFVVLGPKIITYLISLFLRLCKRNPFKPLADDYAIITGSSDGIGLEFARKLAQKGYNLLLISRTQSKLENIQNEISEKYSVDVQILAADFTKQNIYSPIYEKIKLLGGRIAVLVNNVGMMNPIPQELTEISDPEYNTNMLICNTLSVVRMCEIVLPIMKNQKFGIVINVSSVAGLSAVPYMSVYSATKAFVSTFTTSIEAEYEGYGIIIQDYIPNQVTTNLSKTLSSNVYSISAENAVKSLLKTVGKELHSSGHLKHKFLNQMSIFLKFWFPEFLQTIIAKNLIRRTYHGDKSRVHP